MIVLNESRNYSIAVAVLAIFDMVWESLSLAKLHFTHSWWYILVEVLVLAFFIFDYVVRLIQAKGKWLFIRRSMFDFIAIISLHPSLSFFRIPRLLHIFRVPELLKRLKIYKSLEKIWTAIHNFVSINGLIHVLYINFFAIIIGSVFVYLLEKGITFPTFGDAVWWACVTVTTVGYGDYVPKTFLGRVVAVILMIVGIGLISMLTGTVATFFANLRKKTKLQQDLDDLNKTVSSMDEAQLSQLITYAKDLKSFTPTTTPISQEESGDSAPKIDKEVENTTDGGYPLGQDNAKDSESDSLVPDTTPSAEEATEGLESYLNEKKAEESKEGENSSNVDPPERPI